MWLMRQAGRHMASFRSLTRGTTFRERTETPELSMEVSLQPYHSYRPDGVIVYKDILTILPSLGIDFDIVSRKGPVLDQTVRTWGDFRKLTPLEDPSKSFPFLAETLQGIRSEVSEDTTVIGFVGSPWTLAGYLVEGGSMQLVPKVLDFARERPMLLRMLMEKLCEDLSRYAAFQVENGAHIIQVFDSWAFLLERSEYDQLSLHYTNRMCDRIRALCPGVPIVLYTHGSDKHLFSLRDARCNVIAVDERTPLSAAHSVLGPDIILQGNMDPTSLLMGVPEALQELHSVLDSGLSHHVVNVGSGLSPLTPEENVRAVFEEMRSFYA